MKNNIVIIAGLMVVVVLAFALGTSQGSATHTKVSPRVPAVEGNIQVFYDLDLGDGKGGSTGDRPQLYNLIEFHEHYLVLMNKAGTGKIIPLSQIQKFSWK